MIFKSLNPGHMLWVVSSGCSREVEHTSTYNEFVESNPVGGRAFSLSGFSESGLSILLIFQLSCAARGDMFREPNML